MVLRTFQTAEQDSGRSSAVTSLALIDVDIRELLKVALCKYSVSNIFQHSYMSYSNIDTLLIFFSIETNYIVSIQCQLR